MPAVLLNPSLRRSQATLINLLEVSLYHKVCCAAPPGRQPWPRPGLTSQGGLEVVASGSPGY